MLVEVDLSGAVDVAAERARYGKDLAAAFQERDKTAAKLANPSFAERAPGPVVAKTRDRLLAAEVGHRPDRSGARRASHRLSTALRALASVEADPVRTTRGPLSSATLVDSPGVAPAAPADADQYVTRLREVEAQITSRWGEGRIHPTKERIAALVDLLGEPQRSYRSIHLTGTNGKTTTARMIEEILYAFGLRTGRYTSPHLSSITERIVLSGEPISARRFVEDLCGNPAVCTAGRWSVRDQAVLLRGDDRTRRSPRSPTRRST